MAIVIRFKNDSGLVWFRSGALVFCYARRAINILISRATVSRFVPDHKFVHDSVHGSIRLEGVALALLEAPELQRLHSIHQLGLAYLVYPGANHTRFEHSLGTFAVARKMSSSLRLDPEEARLVECAAFLHDIGHLPYSHTLEFALHHRFGIDHAEISRRLIKGEESVLSDREKDILGRTRTIPEILEAAEVDPKEVASLLEGKPPAEGARFFQRQRGQRHFNEKRYMHQMINGPVDADQLDYLKRDSHYTGVAYGVIDTDRLLGTIEIFNGDLVVDKSGVSAVEGILVARALMFTSVYLHRTVRISELMLAKAVEELEEDEVRSLHAMTDASLLALLASKGGYSEEIAVLIKYRKLYKRAYSVQASDLSEEGWELVERLGSMARRRSAEAEIARKAGVPEGSVIIDVPSGELAISEPRISLTDVRVLDDGRVRLLSRISPLAQSLHTRRTHTYALMVACPAKHREKVARAAARVVGL